MGKCISTKESNVDLSKSNKDNVKSDKIKEINPAINNDPQLPDKFRDMPEIEGKYVGEGVRRMNAYKCDLVIDELQKLQEEFWSEKMNVNKVMWKQIKQICLVDEGRAKNLLKTNNLKALKGCINLIQDNEGIIYRVPNFCINQPYFEKEIAKLDKIQGINSKTLHLFMYDLYANKKWDINADNMSSGLQIKKIFCEISNIQSEDYTLKFIFGGSEIKDEHLLCQYNIDNEYTIQVFRVKKELN